ncbi:hypothetical protein P7D85_14290 [Enterococcus hulanensis]|uniref:Uncharacterized protein n=1 Tax=Enterococcus hulanensis TaxID=2559929 RepID=A0ABU3F1E8_9ENTE|nr:hypothetical protein [Enterococcus hulanensis]MDT2600952.1 hypothetical protein [Enterococcus hulanensis]MDT2611540.1 hypothetical protein [Enterococcus hulanensis]MDT2617975.1 hypothetical protein [Enterococcus hulanensis]MDT2628978.1 hypothetical protein [Enterococcus hulanensis]MDT2656540.1 hypothetical protein [Enterococcus hulanensis]
MVNKSRLRDLEGKNNNLKLMERIEMSRYQRSQYNKQEKELDSNTILNLLKAWVGKFQEVDVAQVKPFNFSFNDSKESLKTLEVNQYDILHFDYHEWAKNNFDKDYMNNIVDMIKRFEPASDKVEYLWLTTKEDGMPIVVGRTQTNRNDLFKLLGRGGRKNIKYQGILDLMSTTTEKIILANSVEDLELDRDSQILRDYEKTIAKINRLLREYSKYAFIIPLTSKYPKYANGNFTSDGFEQSLGDYLYKKSSILNYHSHRKSRELCDELVMK